MSFIVYDMKTDNRLGFGKGERKTNWQWEDDWNKTNTVQKPEAKPEETAKEQIVAENYEDAIKKSGETKMEVLAFFVADWCSWCQKLKKDTLSDPKVKEAMKKYVVVYINADQDKATPKKFGIKYLPSYVVTNSQEKNLNSDGGFKTTDQFIQWLNGKPSQIDPDKKTVKPKLNPKSPKMYSEIKP